MFKQDDAISAFNGKPLKLVDQFIISVEKKAWTALNKLFIIWKSDFSDKIMQEFLLSVAVSVLQFGRTT